MTTPCRVVLTDRFLKSLEPAPAGKRIVHWDAAKPSFGVRVTDHGVITFFVMRRMPGNPRPIRVSLGRYPGISLAQARRLATAALGDLVSGVHPKQRERERQGNTFAALVERFLHRPAATKLRTAAAIEGVISRHLVPRWGARPAAEIRRADVIAMLEAIDRESGPYAASKALTLASSVFRFGITREYVENNPCHLIKPSDFVGEMAPRQRVLTEAEIALVWEAAKGEIRNGIESTYPAGPFARFLLLTAVRRSEGAHMTWNEVDLDAALWIVPAQRTKSGIPHEVPLSDIAADLLRSLPRFADGDFIFSTTGGRIPIKDFSQFKTAIDRRAAKLAPPGLANWRFHDLRRTARTNLASLGVAPFIAELILGHTQKGVHAVYDVHRYQAEKREALERWASRLRDIVTPPPTNVRQLRAAADA
jgi:integrase